MHDLLSLIATSESQGLEFKASIDKSLIESLDYIPFVPKSGMLNPNMGTNFGFEMEQKTGFGDALFSTTQQRVLGYLFGQPERSYFAKELTEHTGGGSGAVQRELKRLESSGLVKAERRAIKSTFSPTLHRPFIGNFAALSKSLLASRPAA